MRLELRSGPVAINKELSDSIERRLRFALGRFAGRIGRVTVRLREEDSPRGGPVTGCRIVARLANSGEVRIEETGADLRAIVNSAVHRIGESVRRELERRREQQEGRAGKRDL